MTLIRRLSFDLIGLPPTPEQVDAFVSDRSPTAYEKLVDRLLSSPRHGEHWAHFWLDLVRFAETDGFKADDLRPGAWRYRDYVIRSFNSDKPYDRFVREQLAGDELYPDDAEALIATGFNRHYPDEYNAVNLEQRRQEILNDMTDTTGQVFLGLTLGCARCHDHKFDPIEQEDYYRIQAFFAAYQPEAAPLGTPEELDRYRRQIDEWQAATKDLREQMAKLEEPVRRELAVKQRSRFTADYQRLLDIPEAEQTPMQRQLAQMIRRQVVGKSDQVSKSMKGEAKQKWQELARQMDSLKVPRPEMLPTALAMTDVGPVAPPTYLLKRGNWQARGPEIEPGFLSAIASRPAHLPTPVGTARTTGRRSVLAEWLTRPDHPLTARVLVNRLWQQHFGKGIVATPSDFGLMGEPPTHPELLDWLACEFVESGWSMKAIHRLIVLSATYRMANRFDAVAYQADPKNDLLWRRDRRRLAGEGLRDAILAVSGDLNHEASGPSVYPELPAEMEAGRGGWPVSADPSQRNRRSVYVFAKRNMRYPLFTAFDAPDGNETCARRHATTTAPQALMLLNGKLVLDQARAFAERVTREVGGDPGPVVEHAFRLALGRSPQTDERALLLSFLNRRTPADLCHVLLNLNEFLYVD